MQLFHDVEHRGVGEVVSWHPARYQWERRTATIATPT